MYRYVIVDCCEVKLPIMGRTSVEWLKGHFPEAQVVSEADAEDHLATPGNVVLYSDTPLVDRYTVDGILEYMELKGIQSAILPRGYVTGEGESEVVAESENDFVRLTGPDTYAYIAHELRQRIIAAHMANGVYFVDPATVYIDADVVIGEGTLVKPNNILSGNTVIGKGVTLNPGNNLTDTVVGDGSTLTAMVTTEASVGIDCKMGPYSYLRPGANIGNGVKVGDFVEVKNSNVSDGAKLPHLAYVGDADVGKRVNVGCGVIFANYDGKKKHRTTVLDGAFIGSNTTLIAPVKVGEMSFIAAGATVAHEVPDGAFVIARVPETVKPDKGRKYLEK